MLRSFKSTLARALFERTPIAQFVNFRAVAGRKFRMLHRATRVYDLRIPPNKRLEALKHDRKGQHSIRINDQWKICFRFDQGDARDVEIVDYR